MQHTMTSGATKLPVLKRMFTQGIAYEGTEGNARINGSGEMKHLCQKPQGLWCSNFLTKMQIKSRDSKESRNVPLSMSTWKGQPAATQPNSFKFLA